jgi:hypothetical protein
MCKGTDAKYINTKLLLKYRNETVSVDIVANHIKASYETISGADSNIISGLWQTQQLNHVMS